MQTDDGVGCYEAHAVLCHTDVWIKVQAKGTSNPHSYEGTYC
jgi:hypothetical protein